MANRLSWKFLRKNDLFHLRLWLESVLDLNILNQDDSQFSGQIMMVKTRWKKKLAGF